MPEDMRDLVWSGWDCDHYDIVEELHRIYDEERNKSESLTYRQRLALILGQKQRQRTGILYEKRIHV